MNWDLSGYVFVPHQRDVDRLTLGAWRGRVWLNERRRAAVKQTRHIPAFLQRKRQRKSA